MRGLSAAGQSFELDPACEDALDLTRQLVEARERSGNLGRLPLVEIRAADRGGQFSLLGLESFDAARQRVELTLFLERQLALRPGGLYRG